MSKNPQSKKEGKSQTTKCKQVKASEIAYSVIIKAHEWFRYDKAFQRTDLYNQLDNHSNFIQI